MNSMPVNSPEIDDGKARFPALSAIRHDVVVLDVPLLPAQRLRLHNLAPHLELREGLTPEHLLHATVAFLGRGQVEPKSAPRLRWVQTSSAGVPGWLPDSLLAVSGIPVATASGVYSTTVAEMVIAQMLALMRCLPHCLDLKRRKVWRESLVHLRGRSCRGRTLGIVGYGSIGREVARLGHALGMRVLACQRAQVKAARRDRYALPGVGDPDGVLPSIWYHPAQLGEMLASTDVLVITLPDAPGTRGMVGRAELQALPSDSLVINVGRGSVLDEAALIDLLRAGRIAGAGLDVFAVEPLPRESPLWEMPNVVISPHIGSYTEEQPELAGEVFLENVRRDLAGESLLNLIDFRSGC